MSLRDLIHFSNPSTDISSKKSDPFFALQSRMNRLFNDSLSTAGADFSVDILEKDKEYILQAELPGVKEEDIKLSLSDSVMTISAEKDEEKEEKEDNYIYSERVYGSFKRSFNMPEAIDADKIEASFKDGILKVNIPKKADAIKHVKQINIKKE